MTLEELEIERRYYQVLKAVSFILLGMEFGMAGTSILQIIKTIKEQNMELDQTVMKAFFCLCYSYLGVRNVKDFFEEKDKLDDLDEQIRKLKK